MEVNPMAIRVELAKKNWNCVELAKASGLPYTTLMSIMQGKVGGTLKTVGKIAKGLGVTVDEILKDTEEVKDNE